MNIGVVGGSINRPFRLLRATGGIAVRLVGATRRQPPEIQLLASRPCGVLRGMRLHTIQIGSARPSRGEQFNTTGIFKEAVSAAVVNRLGLVDDVVVDTKNHGGPDQAVYIYTRDDYQYWEAQLERDLPGGAFGENLTVSGLVSADVRTGDRFEIGEVVLEATAGRIPCKVFQDKMGEVGWVKRFRNAGRPGIYCRVIEQGEISAESSVNYLPASAENLTIADTFELYYDRSASVEQLERALLSPVAIRLREDIERRLAACC